MKIPMIFAPVVFLFIFGGFDSDFCRTIAAVGSMKFLLRSFKDHQEFLRREQAAKDAAPVTKEPEPAMITARHHPAR